MTCLPWAGRDCARSKVARMRVARSPTCSGCSPPVWALGPTDVPGRTGVEGVTDGQRLEAVDAPAADSLMEAHSPASAASKSSGSSAARWLVIVFTPRMAGRTQYWAGARGAPVAARSPESSLRTKGVHLQLGRSPDTGSPTKASVSTRTWPPPTQMAKVGCQSEGGSECFMMACIPGATETYAAIRLMAASMAFSSSLHSSSADFSSVSCPSMHGPS
mmetsp:Transcript_53585/g.159925  ORF Transcript_53585/g.159925 Transcript_53585/m.159925 type:complete len:218 (-) Transcript_53585:420-1073(-)